MWGSERALLDLVTHIDRQRFEVTVVCPPDSPLQEELARAGVNTLGAPLQLLHLRGRIARMQAAWCISAIIRRFAPHIVHVNQAGLLRVTAVACRLARTPLICHVRLLEDARQLWKRPPGWLRPRRYIAISEVVRRELEKDLTPDEVPVSRIYDPLDCRSILESSIASRTPDARSQLSIPAGAKVVALFGRVCPAKRQELLIEAAAVLRDRDIYYLMVGGESPQAGPPSYVEMLSQRCRELGLEQRVLFMGLRGDVPAIMQACDAVVLASEEEAFGRVLLEALALGKPIVGPAAGGPGEIIGGNERGLAFSAGSAPSLAEAIRNTLANSAAARLRTELGREWVRKECSPTRHARQIEQVYAQLSCSHERAPILRTS